MTFIAPPFSPIDAIASFRRAAQLNREDPYRQGSILRLPAYGQAVMTGDLHGHMKNFDKLTRYAMLDRVAARHVILHEMVHCETGERAVDHSHQLLLQAAQFKCTYPEQVHFLQSNHELAQFTGYPIAKNGRPVIDDYNNSVEFAYGSDIVDEALDAMNEFISTFPIAIRTENRVWMSHSLPNRRDMEGFDYSVFERELTPADIREDGPVFRLVWGRNHTREQLDEFAAKLDVDIFITGHQPQEQGFDVRFDRLIILASDHNHGTFLPFDLSRKQTVDDLIQNIRKFVAVE